ncbi:MAG: chorismate synthase [Clostridia bacterium]|nr:chorismate synthase [Clostridia bacterium]
MSVFNGDVIKIEIFGESHSAEIGFRASGIPNMKLDEQSLSRFLKRRMANGEAYSTPRIEKDEPIFIKGYDNGLIGGDLEVVIKNENVKSGDYIDLYGKPRPSHADYCAFIKDGTLDFRGGGRFSGRMTAPLAVCGGILKQFLEARGIKINAYLSGVGKVEGRSYRDGGISSEEIEGITGFPALSHGEEMLREIAEAKAAGDSVGGVCECVISGAPAGLGDCLFEGLEGKIAALVYAVPAVKGVEFGGGFALSETCGSVANDAMRYEDDKVVKVTNNSGGINGGISDGSQITFRAAIKPTPSISLPQKTVDLVKKENAEITVRGRHDACVAVRALPVIESAAAIALTDEILKAERKKDGRT